ncbi:hypothetical protein EJ04DRAFT_516963, partial [Polyplosphaeria fusca]
MVPLSLSLPGLFVSFLSRKARPWLLEDPSPFHHPSTQSFSWLCLICLSANRTSLGNSHSCSVYEFNSRRHARHVVNARELLRVQSDL